MTDATLSDFPVVVAITASRFFQNTILFFREHEVNKAAATGSTPYI